MNYETSNQTLSLSPHPYNHTDHPGKVVARGGGDGLRLYCFLFSLLNPSSFFHSINQPSTLTPKSKQKHPHNIIKNPLHQLHSKMIEQELLEPTYKQTTPAPPLHSRSHYRPRRNFTSLKSSHILAQILPRLNQDNFAYGLA